MSMKLAAPKVTSRSSRALHSAIALLVILGVVVFTSCDGTRLQGSLASFQHTDRSSSSGIAAEVAGGMAGAGETVPAALKDEDPSLAALEVDTRSVEQIFSDIKHEISDSGSGSATQRAIATRVAATADIVRSEVVHGHGNYRASGSDFDAAASFSEILNTSPVVIFVDSAQDSELLRSLLHRHYEVSPAPAVVDLEKHSRGAQLESFIRLYKTDQTSNPSPREPPYLFVNGQSVINTDFKSDIQDLHAQNKLAFGKTEVSG